MKIEYVNKWRDIFEAVSLGEAKSVASGRQVLWFLGCFMVLYWFIPPLLQDPTQPVNWVMGVVAICLALYVWQGPSWYNRRFAKRYAAASPKGQAVLEEEGFRILDSYGESIFRFSENIQIFDREGLLTIAASEKRFAVIPLYQQTQEIQQQWRSFLQKNAAQQYQSVTDKKKGKKNTSTKEA